MMEDENGNILKKKVKRFRELFTVMSFSVAPDAA